MAVVVSPTAAQSGALTGVVADETGAVLPGATVTLSGGPAGSRETQTDAAGRFTFPGLAPGAYRLTVFLSGFGEVTVDRVSVAADTVELPPITLWLASFDEAVVVTATRIEEPLQQVPMSISAVTGADIERRAIGNLTELSRWTPGLMVVDQGARSTFRRDLASVRYRLDDATNIYFTRSEGYRIGGGNNFRVCSNEGDRPAQRRRPGQ